MRARMIRLGEVLHRTGLSRSTLYRLRADGTFPDRVRLSTRSVGWVESQVDAWIAARHEQSAGAPVGSKATR